MRREIPDPNLNDNPILTALAGQTLADNDAHVVARSALLNRLRTHPAVVELCRGFEQRSGLAARLEAAVAAQDALARALGLPHRGYLDDVFDRHTNPATGAVELAIPEAQKAEIERLWREAEAAGEHVSPESLDVSELARAIERLVRGDWKLPWPWLVVELLRLWALSVRARFEGVQYHVTLESEPADPPAPSATFEFRVLPGETVQQAIRRLRAEAAAFERRLSAGRPPAGKHRSHETVERYTDWFYRHRLLGESINSIARSDPYGVERSDVRKGIRLAERLLGAAQHTFELEGGGDV